MLRSPASATKCGLTGNKIEVRKGDWQEATENWAVKVRRQQETTFTYALANGGVRLLYYGVRNVEAWLREAAQVSKVYPSTEYVLDIEQCIPVANALMIAWIAYGRTSRRPTRAGLQKTANHSDLTDCHRLAPIHNSSMKRFFF